MAERGKPLPIRDRLAIREAAKEASQRDVARQFGVARETVRKYAPKQV
jgi:ribosomal protein S14